MARCVAITLLASLVALIGCGDSDEQSSPAQVEPNPPLETIGLRVDDAFVRAEIADDPAERARGLGGRARLGRNAGMYFITPTVSPRIWMKGMRFPLDLIWIAGERVVDITPRVPNEPPGTPDSALPLYSPSRPANNVLEVNAGWAQRNGVRPGDPVRITD